MIPYEIDPSLHTGEPVPGVLDDGFSPPPQREPPPTGTVEPDVGADAASVPQGTA